MAWDWNGPYQGIVLIDPETGEPYTAGGGEGSSISSDQLPANLGPQTSLTSLSITYSSDEPVYSVAAGALRVVWVDAAGVIVDDDEPALVDPASTGYETVAASQTDQVLGTAGAAGDLLVGIIIQPSTTAPGAVVVKDNATTIYTWPGSATYPSHLAPLLVPFNLRSVSGAWKITTGANETVLAAGAFTV